MPKEVQKAPANSADPVPDLMKDSHDTAVRDALKLIDTADGDVRPEAEAKSALKAEAKPTLTPEQKPTTETKSAPVEESKAKGWAAIKKAEKKLQQDRERTQQERHEFEQWMKSTKTELDGLKSGSVDFRKKLAAKPIETLKEVGLTYQDLTNMILEEGQSPAVDKLQREESSSEMKALQESVQQLQQQLQQRDQDNQMNKYRGEISSTLNNEEFSILQTMPNAEQELLDFAAGYARKTGQLLQASEVAVRMKEFWEHHLQSLSSHKAARKILGLADPAESSPQKGKPQKPESKTLTNTGASSPTVPVQEENQAQPMSDEQILQDAMKYIPDNIWDALD